MDWIGDDPKKGVPKEASTFSYATEKQLIEDLTNDKQENSKHSENY